MTYRRRRPPLAQRLLMAALIFFLSWAFAGFSAFVFWVLLTKWPMDYDNIPLVLWAVAWVEQSYVSSYMRREAKKEGLL